MVFSIFKKPDKKNPITKGLATKSASKMTPSSSPAGSGKSVPAHKPVGAQADELDYAPKGRGHIELQIKDSHDPVESDIEEAAILFANSQDSATQSVLENSVKMHRTKSGEKLWLMLFDFYQHSEDRAKFDALGIEYAKIYERSTPIWRGENTNEQEEKAQISPGGLVTLPFKGGLMGNNSAAFNTIEDNIGKTKLLRVDFTRVNDFDPEGCNKLVELLKLAKKQGCQLKLLGRDSLLKKIKHVVDTSPPGEGQGCWLLLLELYQIMGLEALFEDTALNYAINFEVSPPWWDTKRVDVIEATAKATNEEAEFDDEPLLLEDIVEAADSDTYPLLDEIRNARFEGLGDFAQKHNPSIIDFSGVKRIDFVSAGLLINILTPAKRAGKHIIIKNPNHLVSALLTVVGVQSVAEIQAIKR